MQNVRSSIEAGIRPRRLLIIGCSEAKSLDEDSIPALLRYDGPQFRVVRKYLRNSGDRHLTVMILSAEHGLISSELPILSYDRRMTPPRAIELRSTTNLMLRQLAEQAMPRGLDARKLHVNLSKDYLQALSGDDDFGRELVEICVARGSRGKRLSRLHEWLYDGEPLSLDSKAAENSELRLRGSILDLDRASVLEIARQAVARHSERATRIAAWAVSVDGQDVAPKWLVSEATGIPVGQFTTSEARSFLGRLGIEVRRV